MNNEEKILGLLEKMDARMNNLEQGQVELKQDISKLDSRVASIETDVSDIKENLDEVRTSVNVVADWADRAEFVVKVPLIRQSE